MPLRVMAHRVIRAAGERLTVADVLARIGATDSVHSGHSPSILAQEVLEYGFCTSRDERDRGALFVHCGGEAFFVMVGHGRNTFYLVHNDDAGRKWEHDARALAATDPSVNAPGVLGPRPSNRISLVWSV